MQRNPLYLSIADFLAKLKHSSTSGPGQGAAAAAAGPGSAAASFPKPPSFARGVMADSTSSLLGRLSAFLPQIAASNKELEAKIASEGQAAVNIEAVSEDEEHIAMVSEECRTCTTSGKVVALSGFAHCLC
jgi:Domain of unknown function (DUF4598)